MSGPRPLILNDGQVEQLPAGETLDPAATVRLVPVVTGASPPQLVDDGTGGLVLVEFTG